MSLLNVRDIFYSIEGDNLLKCVQFHVNQGEIISLQGSSGSGKSCLLALLAGLLTPLSGKIIFCGCSNRNILLNRSFIGLVPQENIFLAHENVLFNALLAYRLSCSNKEESSYKDYAKELLDYFQLAHDVSPQNLSGGEKRKLSVIRALMLRPKLLLLDEYSSGLDADNKNCVWQVLQDSRSSMIVVTHDNSLASRCSRGLLLYNGNIKIK